MNFFSLVHALQYTVSTVVSRASAQYGENEGLWLSGHGCLPGTLRYLLYIVMHVLVKKNSRKIFLTMMNYDARTHTCTSVFVCVHVPRASQLACMLAHA